MNRLKMPIWSLATGLIILQMILIAIIVHGESLTFDEGDHIFAGYMMWHSGDYGLNPEHPPLVKLVATLPLLVRSFGYLRCKSECSRVRRTWTAAILWSGTMAQGMACSSACAWRRVYLPRASRWPYF